MRQSESAPGDTPPSSGRLRDLAARRCSTSQARRIELGARDFLPTRRTQVTSRRQRPVSRGQRTQRAPRHAQRYLTRSSPGWQGAANQPACGAQSSHIRLSCVATSRHTVVVMLLQALDREAESFPLTNASRERTSCRGGRHDRYAVNGSSATNVRTIRSRTAPPGRIDDEADAPTRDQLDRVEKAAGSGLVFKPELCHPRTDRNSGSLEMRRGPRGRGDSEPKLYEGLGRENSRVLVTVGEREEDLS